MNLTCSDRTWEEKTSWWANSIFFDVTFANPVFHQGHWCLTPKTRQLSAFRPEISCGSFQEYLCWAHPLEAFNHRGGWKPIPSRSSAAEVTFGNGMSRQSSASCFPDPPLPMIPHCCSCPACRHCTWSQTCSNVRDHMGGGFMVVDRYTLVNQTTVEIHEIYGSSWFPLSKMEIHGFPCEQCRKKSDSVMREELEIAPKTRAVGAHEPTNRR